MTERDTLLPLLFFGAFTGLILSLGMFRDGPTIAPGVVSECKRGSYGDLRVKLTDGRSLSLDATLARGGCLPVGTRIERRGGDFAARIDGARPVSYWYIGTAMAVIGTLMFWYSCGGLLRQPNGSSAPRPDFIETAIDGKWQFIVSRSAPLHLLHPALLGGCVTAIWSLSAVLGGLQKYELFVACAILAIVSGAVGGRWMEGPWQRWTATRIGLDHSSVTIAPPWWRGAAIRLPLLAVKRFEPAAPGSSKLVAFTDAPQPISVKVQTSTPAGTAPLCSRLNHALDALSQPNQYRE